MLVIPANLIVQLVAHEAHREDNTRVASVRRALGEGVGILCQCGATGRLCTGNLNSRLRHTDLLLGSLRHNLMRLHEPKRLGVLGQARSLLGGLRCHQCRLLRCLQGFGHLPRCIRGLLCESRRLAGEMCDTRRAGGRKPSSSLRDLHAVFEARGKDAIVLQAPDLGAEPVTALVEHHRRLLLFGLSWAAGRHWLHTCGQ
mmetsp:Transcript_71337/g.204691  ORF Transcript_71337/g.204691 Transcript_71337/m.204691 type:complete len:200 (-) Transcript_71337:783-1382(-)